MRLRSFLKSSHEKKYTLSRTSLMSRSPRGGGGSWPGTNAGFGWGNGGDLTCAVDAFDVASHEKTTFNEKNAHGKKNVFGAARFVSSALVACEVPDVFVARDDTFFSEPQDTQETDVRLRAAVAEIGFASFENENETAVKLTTIFP